MKAFKLKINRTQLPKLIEELELPEVSILLGSRQVGKTHLLKELENVAKLSHKKTAYFNLEIPQDLLMFQKSDLDLFNMLTGSGFDVVFIDEFHYLPNASKLFKAIYDSEHAVKIVVSGSSSIEIHKHLKESLAGRRLVTRIFPLSLEEYKQAYPELDEQDVFNQYILYGGLPGLIHINNPEEKIRYLQDMLETYIQKDIKSLIKEENIRAFNMLIYLLMQNQGQLVSVHSLANDIGVSSPTVEKYLSILEATYVLYPLHSYSKNLGNELKKSRKYYFYDLGMRNAVLKDFRLEKRPDLGAIYETFVCHLLTSQLLPNQELKFWRTRQGEEIDFVLLENRVPSIIEVKANNAVIPKAFQRFVTSYTDTQRGIVYTMQASPTQYCGDVPISYIPFYA